MSEFEEASEDAQDDDAGERSAGQYEDPRNPQGRVLRDVSQAMVRLYKEQFGRGPESVQTHFASPDILISILSNSLTPVERNMRDIGEAQRLRDIRMMFQHTTEPQFRAIVETITGRRVIGFMSGMDVNVDESCEVFTLAPES
ncbi:MAG: hypothetical protein QOK35_3503 [Pseudonocardiales bacterium]|jgi:uncharacterized protein YbcI|nr:hypothetical protein [Pseudonocardiales bacterium]